MTTKRRVTQVHDLSASYEGVRRMHNKLKELLPLNGDEADIDGVIEVPWTVLVDATDTLGACYRELERLRLRLRA